MAIPMPASVTEFRKHLNKTGSIGEDEELELHLAGATLAVEGLIGPMVVREVAESVRAKRGVALLSRPPLTDLTSFVARDGTEYDVDELDFDLPSGVINGTFPAGRYTVTYQAGRAPVPENQKIATLIVAAHLWDTQRGRSARSRTIGDGGDPGTNQGVTAMLAGFALPNRALEMLQRDIEDGIA